MTRAYSTRPSVISAEDENGRRVYGRNEYKAGAAIGLVGWLRDRIPALMWRVHKAPPSHKESDAVAAYHAGYTDGRLGFEPPETLQRCNCAVCRVYAARGWEAGRMYYDVELRG